MAKIIYCNEWSFPAIGRVLVLFDDAFIIRLLFANGNREKALAALQRQEGQTDISPCETYVSHCENDVSQLCKEELSLYCAGKLRNFTVPVRVTGTAYEQSILTALRQIPYGRTVSYGELSRFAGHISGARAVGGALGRNPVPVLVPCHRVIRGDGTIGGFTGGLEIKRRLLGLEGVSFGSDGKVRCSE